MKRKWLLALSFALWTNLISEVEAYQDGESDDVTLLLHQALDRVLGGKGAYELYTYPSERQDPPGFFPRLELMVQDAQVGDVPLAYVQLTLRSLQLDVDALHAGRIALKKADVEKLEAVLTETDLAKVLRRQKFARKVSDLKVRCSRDTVWLTGRTQVGFIAPEAKLSGGFEVVDEGRKVLFIPDDVTLGGFSAGQNASGKVMKALNPLIDLEEIKRKYRVDLRVRDVQVRNGEIRVRS